MEGALIGRNRIVGWAALCAVALTTTGCATMGSGGGYATELDRANAQCVGAVVIGGLLGAVAGNNIGDGNAGRGALIGAGAGGVACVIIREAARERDAVIRYQREAAASGMNKRSEWVGASGKRFVMDTVVQADTASDSGQRCSYSTSTVNIEGMGAAPIGRQRWCEGPDGVLVPA